ncbi:MAG: hypothetical protein LBS41_04700 [Streptococcaceae bacterium]|jgi:hypothetical protein|nr:hypothetical protein [Streptococcaceae bacterium]
MNPITFYAYPAGTITGHGKSLVGHMFFSVTTGTVLGWAPRGGGQLNVKDDWGNINYPGVRSATFYVGDATLGAIQGEINSWIGDTSGYCLLFKDCVSFVKAIIDVINQQAKLKGQTTIPDTWSKFPDSVIDKLINISQLPAFNGVKIGD